MLELRTFGGLSVEANGAPLTGAAVQRKTLALLALLAAAGKNGLSRDKLIAYLWPETDTEHGRNLLNQACYALRRDLREREVLLGGSELRLNQAVVASDVQAFVAALQRGDSEAAVQVYTGPFLDGFFVSGAPELERWVDAERAQLAKQCTDALVALAKAAAVRGDHRAAADWWRRLTALDPLSSHAALGLMKALVAAGESAAAIKHARAHEAFLQQEMGTAPDAALLALVKQLCEEAQRGNLLPGVTEQQRKRRQSTTDFLLAALPAVLRAELRRATTLSTVAAALGIVLVVGAVGYGVSGRHGPTSEAEPLPVADRKMLAVLPFENRGARADEYFADGLTEAIATRLGSVRRLGVIAWQSASQYKGTNKSPQEIGRELGVQYILNGSVRWEKTGGASRVRVSTTLIRVSDAAQLWADQYDTTLTGVFAVQTNLATRVAGALDLALIDAERRLLEARPTANLQAYDAYLRGRVLGDREFDPANGRKSVRQYEQAVALDSNFALAYDWLSVGYVWMYQNHMDRAPDLVTRAKAALDRALRLDPNLPESHAALGFYLNVLGDKDKALQEYTRARRMRPSDPWFPALIAAIYEANGRWNEALAYRREAVALDPRNVLIMLMTGASFMERRQFAAATYYYDRALALKPESFDAQLGKAMAYMGQTGDLSGAQRLLPDLLQTLDPTGQNLPILQLSDVATLFDAGRRVGLLALTPAALDGDSAVLALTKAMVQRANGHGPQARAQFDSARSILEVSVRQEPNDDYYAALLGLALAGLGRSAEAIREGERAVALVPVSKDAEWNAYLRANLARIYVLLGERDKAIERLEIVLSRPGPLSAGWLRADPFWDPLRRSPRFQRLVAVRN
jgi:serine/threonine-protein kinase